MKSGFRNSRQTKDNILVLSQKVKEEFNKGGKTLPLFFDVASAFDRFRHNGLIFKQISIKILYYLIKIFISFLSERKFVVKVGEAVSTIRCPTLFSIYINDIPMLEGNNTFSLLFADNILLFYPI